MFDLILQDVMVMDGSGKESYRADVGIKGVAIKKIGDLKDSEAARRVDGGGRMVCPGFIDCHSHADLAFFREDHAQVLSPLIRQGITTFVGGHCGMGLAPITEENREGQKTYLEVFTQMDFEAAINWDTMASFMEHMDNKGLPLNAAILVPHGIIRISAIGLQMKLAEKKDIAYMKRLLEESLEAGAFGLSTGLQYIPGNQSDTRELVELGESIARYDGIFSSHLRSYTNTTLGKAIDEVAEVAGKNDIRGQVNHILSVPWMGPIHRQALKALKWLANHPDFATRAVPNALLYGDMNKVLKRLKKHRDSGVQIGMDLMPTTVAFTHPLAFLPTWVLTGTKENILARVADKAIRADMLEDIEKGRPTWPHSGKNDWSLNIMRQLGWDAVTIMAVHSEKNRPLEGRKFTEIAEEQGKHPFDVMCDLFLEEDGQVLVYITLSEPDDAFTERSKFPVLVDPQTSIVSDTILLGVGKPSHLFFGCYPGFISRYVNELGLVDLPTAIARCTSLPAKQFGIENRGLVKEGFFADLLMIDPEKFSTRACFRDPEHHPEGLDMVMINGKVVVDGNGFNPEMLPGMMLRKHDQSVHNS